jgi:Protein of unknown function (DUF4233)
VRPPAQRDPLRGLRGIFVGVLIMEAIVVGLAVLVVARLGGGLGGPAGWYTGALALALTVAAGVQRFSWGLGLALALQVAMVAGWFAHPALGGLGLLFVLVWCYLLYVRWAVSRRDTIAVRQPPGQEHR